jgi:hypothetical protein
MRRRSTEERDRQQFASGVMFCIWYLICVADWPGLARDIAIEAGIKDDEAKFGIVEWCSVEDERKLMTEELELRP